MWNSSSSSSNGGATTPTQTSSSGGGFSGLLRSAGRKSSESLRRKLGGRNVSNPLSCKALGALLATACLCSRSLPLNVDGWRRGQTRSGRLRCPCQMFHF